MKFGLLSKLTAVFLAVAMVFALTPLTGGHAVYADSVTATGGTVKSNNINQAIAAFGEDNVTASYSSKTLTITLQNDIDLQSPILLKKGASDDTVLIELNGHTITGASGTSGTSEAAAQGKNAIEIQAADYNVIINGTGSVIGGKGAVYEGSNLQRTGNSGGAAVCFVENDDESYWYSSENDSKLEYGLKITGGANITGGPGADVSGEDWVNNILNCSFSTGYSPQFNLSAGIGGPGITQTNARIKNADETPIFTRIEIVDGTVTGGTGGTLDLSTANTPVMTHYGLMNHDAVDTYMQNLYEHEDTYDDYVVRAIRRSPSRSKSNSIKHTVNTKAPCRR